MPRAPAFKIDALADLLRQLEYAPPETRKRQMDAAERLAGEVDPAIAYPREFVIYRITGYRQQLEEMSTFAGAALRSDLTNFVQRLSDALDLKPSREGRAALSLDEVAQRLGVSAKTVGRYRREGLVCHVVTRDGSKRQLACYEDALDRFAASRSNRLGKAARFTRISNETEALIIEEARHLLLGGLLSLSAVAKIIARKHSRAHETIRQMLHKHDKAAANAESQPLFAFERGPLRSREIAILHRAWIRGVDLRPMAERFGRSRPAILRAILRRRAQLLGGLKIAFIEMPTFAMEGADAVILSAPAVSADLLALPPHDDAFRLLDWAAVAQTSDESMEDALLGGWNLLKRRAVAGIARFAEVEAPLSEDVDAVETDLRWATRLHRRLTLLAFPAALRRIEVNLGRSLVAHPAEQIAGMIRLAAGVIREALEGIDPSRGQRLERVVAFAMERALAQRPTSTVSVKATVRHASGAALSLRGVFDALDEWEPWLDPYGRWREHAAALPEAFRNVLVMRYGWNGRAPLTMLAISKHAKRGLPVVARRLQQATRELRAAGR